MTHQCRTEVPRPGRVLRVGVTGARALDPAALRRLEAGIAEVLRAVVTEAQREGAVRLQFLSPLAEGADRLAAETALAEGFELVCPLPFAREEYARDFTDPNSEERFHALLARADDRVLELDGGRGDDEAPSYEAVGRLIVRNCDLIIGVWDGHPGHGRGGTADIIRYAANFGPPVVWLHATDPDAAPRWVEDLHDLRRGSPARPVPRLLASYLRLLLDPPAPPAHGGHQSLLHRAGHGMHRGCVGVLDRVLGRPPGSPMATFLRERRHAVWGPWRLHGWLMRRLAGGRAAPRSEPHAPAEAAASRWFARYQPADARAGEYAARYRSSYVWVFLLAAAALIAVALAPVGRDRPAVMLAITCVELASLSLILLLVLLDGIFAWQRRAIEYRLLAELCRKQQALAPLAWVVPRIGAWATVAPGPSHEPGAPHADGAAWVSWLFGAWLRETPLPTGRLDASRVGKARDAALHDLIGDQIAYHTARRDQYGTAGSRLVRAGELLFLLVLTLVGVRLGLLLRAGGVVGDAAEAWIFGLELAGATLPALSAAFVGIRAYGELELLAEQSEAMLRLMHRARAQIGQLDPAAPLASQALGSELAAVATAMLEDLQGWATLVRAKVVEG